MEFPIERAIPAARHVKCRLESIQTVAIAAKTDPKEGDMFYAAYDTALEVYEQFSAVNTRTVLDDSASDQTTVFTKLAIEIDTIFYQVKSIYIALQRESGHPPYAPLSDKKASTDRGSFESFAAGSNPVSLPVPKSSSISSQGGLTDAGGSSRPRSSVKLPRINLPMFDGSLKSWPTFFDLFSALIHNNDSLSSIEKFQYLISTLSMEPLALVKHLPLTTDNYDIAYKSLVDRYQNERMLASVYWQSICDAPTAKPDCPQSFRDLINVFVENISALQQFPHLDLWDFSLFNMFVHKLDKGTRKRFEMKFARTGFPSFQEVKDFVIDQCRALEADSFSNRRSAEQPVQRPSLKPSWRSSTDRKQTLLVNSPSSSSRISAPLKCDYCRDLHKLMQCPKFLALVPLERYNAVKSLRLCHNCLSPTHMVKSCPSRHTCRQCSASHHSLLHFNKGAAHPISSSPAHAPTPLTSTPPPITLTAAGGPITVLLSTTLVEVRDRWGNFQIVRALCDSGSQSSFMADGCRKRLGLSCSRSSVPISGVGHVTINASRGSTQCDIRPVGLTEPRFRLNPIVLPAICTKLPGIPLPPVQAFENLKLADPHWYQPGDVDILLGADIFASIVCGGFIAGDGERPAAINTVFGWILVGTTTCLASVPVHSFFVTTEPTLDNTLKRFWETEEVPNQLALSTVDSHVETLFKESHYRESSGRFGVLLPFKESSPLPTFEGSLQLADRRLCSLERRLSVQPLLRQQYVDFMTDYLESGHMSLRLAPTDNKCYVIPHHCVVKEDTNGSKLRVVFDASANDVNGHCLNDALLVGPKLQNDLTKILLRFRFYNFAFTADVRQMYRQISVAEPHHQYQLIRWRFSTETPIDTYQLNTVTYGISSSPYLAIRCLLELAHEGHTQFPLAAQAIRSDLYVDDFATGADDLETALELRNQIIALLRTGCFELRKWASNHAATLLSDLPPEHCQIQASAFDDQSGAVKILGLQWQANEDSFSFRVKPVESPCTKRAILSEVARMYDPLGLLCPLTFFAKRLIQHLWLLGLDWDASPPAEVCSQWEKYKSSLSVVSNIKIPRCLKGQSVAMCQLHAFCDASELGYASVVYFRLTHADQSVSVCLVAAKSKVAPLKRISVPRLELCAAVLLAKLVDFVLQTCKGSVAVDGVVAWSDSTVALSWIQSSPHRWKTFVANRVSYIQDRLAPDCWHHVRSGDNPADPASRGLLPEDLVSCRLWWAGPSWLIDPPESWPSNKLGSIPNHVSANSLDLEQESRKVALTTHQTPPNFVDSLMLRISSLRKIQGIIAYCFRFTSNTRGQDKLSGALTASELHRALLHIVKTVQAVAFRQEIAALRAKQPCCKQLQTLSPFLDDNGILRVGGRLAHSSLPFETKHPAFLPRHHRLTELLIWQIHNCNLHPGVNTTMYLLQQALWVVSARRAIRQCISKCYRCFRANPSPLTPPMGDLPVPRVSQVKAFSCVGVDYGGPFSILMSRHRGAKTLKSYLCLFVCFTTRAVHLELASDLSRDAFLAALRRFVARRGRCSKIYSDCGTNFVGANRELVNMMRIAAECEALEWHFNPPSAPHFGGLWESGIKSVKTHFSRVIGSQLLTYEELSTLISQVEAVLNSRPLCSVSTDPNDLNVLTPGHFLTLEPLTAVPDSDLSHLKLSRLSRWQLVQRLHHDFWSRWRDEYLHMHYQRGKWAKTHLFEPCDIGSLVLIKDDLCPPLRWRLGRIEALHPGADNISRVATVRTVQGTTKRPVVKLCPLPSH